MKKNSSKKMREKRLEIFEQQGGRCLCCGKQYHKEQITNTNFAHWYNKSWMDKEEKLTNQSFICEELHNWEHNRPNNLKNNLCVKILIEKYNDKYINLIKSKGLLK